MPLKVRLHDQAVGELWLQDGRFCFQYSDDWLTSKKRVAISAALPLMDKVFDDMRVEAFFDGLLPESPIREKVAKNLRLNVADREAMLSALGGDCFGAVHFGRARAKSVASDGTEALAPAQVLQLIEQVDRFPLFAGMPNVSQSIASDIPVVGVYVSGGKISLPENDQYSTHWLMAGQGQSAFELLNRQFCADLASEVGIAVAKHTPIEVGSKKALLIERIDRAVNKNGQVHAVHHEDFCQAMGVPFAKKYQQAGGPDAIECGALVRRACGADDDELWRFIRQLVFNALIGNHRAHTRTYALDHAYHTARLARQQWIECTALEIGSSNLLAHKINTEQDFENLRMHHWIRLTAPFGFSGQDTRRVFEALVAGVRQALPKVIQSKKRYQGNDEIALIAQLIERRTSRQHWGDLSKG
ncbi:MAG: HipA domain-containing protein [Gammaproteobacteria bacterium]|nr:HipA domain-containing protein [Gammaproteobacteria bacterium]